MICELNEDCEDWLSALHEPLMDVGKVFKNSYGGYSFTGHSGNSFIARFFGMSDEEGDESMIVRGHNLKIKKVIFNNPATIILWEDGEKTVVRCCEGDTYDREKGFMFAVMKRLLGNDGKYKSELQKWIGGEEE